uniref:WAP domain-containing protein n=1 Tax=Romanomermis culicivorax TaxID=13658 RepID=A0A915IMN2_ROMCU
MIEGMMKENEQERRESRRRTSSQLCPPPLPQGLGMCFAGGTCGDNAVCNLPANVCCPTSASGGAGGMPPNWGRPRWPMCRDGKTRAAALCFENYSCGQAHKYECVDGFCCRRESAATFTYPPWWSMFTTRPGGISGSTPVTGGPPITGTVTVISTNATTNGTVG